MLNLYLFATFQLGWFFRLETSAFDLRVMSVRAIKLSKNAFVENYAYLVIFILFIS